MTTSSVHLERYMSHTETGLSAFHICSILCRVHVPCDGIKTLQGYQSTQDRSIMNTSYNVHVMIRSRTHVCMSMYM